MNNKISNPKTEVPKGINLNDKDYTNELLSCLKEMENNCGNRCENRSAAHRRHVSS